MNIESLTESLVGRPYIGPVVQAIKKSRNDQAKDMAASIAYFSFFSLFPLLLGVIAVGSLFLEPDEIAVRVDRVVADTLPGSADFVRRNVGALIRLRGAAGVASIVGLMWSASKMFGAASRGINHALGQKKSQPFYLSPVRSILLALTVSIILLVSATVPTGVELLANLDTPILGQGVRDFLNFADGHLMSFLFELFLFGALYKLVPFERPSWRDILPGALTASVLFELGKAGFVLYLDNVAHLAAVYGSVSSIIALLLWLYFCGRVLLFGAEIIAVTR